jgi:hypothetical protein
MATSTSSSEKNHVPANTGPEMPPEERFWHRYSPHHEFPLSTVGSVLVYVFVGVLVWAVIKLSIIFSAHVPLEVATVEVQPPGGDNPAPPGAPGSPGDKSPKEGVDEPATEDERKELDIPDLKDIPPMPVDKTDLSPDVAVDDSMIDNASQPLRDLSKMGKRTQEALVSGLKGPKKSAGGSNGENGGGGDGSAVRVKRMARWALVFNTHSGEDYANQLAALGAIVGIPTNEPEKFLIIRDLKRPTPQIEDVTKITLMRWADTRPDSVEGLARALRLPGTPQVIWAFFPEEVEKQMKKAEHDYRGLNENQILETRFQVALRGNRYIPVVRDQRPAPR